MRVMMVAMAALGAMTLQAMADTKKPAVGTDEIYWVVRFAIPAGQMDAFKKVVAPLVAATKEEPGALEYEYNETPDHATVDIYERYRSSQAAVDHVTQTFGPKFSKEFLAIAKPVQFVVYGTPDAKLKETLAAFNPVYMAPFDGFSRPDTEATATGSSSPGK